MSNATYRFVRISAWCCIALSVAVLAGWHFNITLLTSIAPGFMPMNPFTALGIIAICSGQLLQIKKNHHPADTIIRYAAALFVVVTGCLRLTDVIAGTSFSFDDILFTKQIRQIQVSPFTAIVFIILGTILILQRFIQHRPNAILYFTAPVFSLSIMSLFGYLIGNNDMLALKPMAPMALHSSACFLVITISFLLMFRRNVVIRTLTDHYSGGLVARSLLPYIILVPLVLGFLRYQGENLGLYNTGFGVSIIVAGTMVSFIVLVIRLSQQLSKTDERRHEAELDARQHSEEIIKMIRTLQARNKELEHFTFVSHHDLQEPLRKIAVFSELIKEQDYEKLSPPSQNKLDKINAAAHNISAALKDVLAYATITGEEPHQSVDLNKVLANALTDLEPLVREKKATVHTVQLPTLSAIPEQMQQVFYNLLSNALKFSKPYEQEPPVIKVTCALFDPAAEPDLDPGKRYHKIAITDNGIGFSPEFSEKIFLMFQRLNNKEIYNGTGIGLAVCRKIVENHNGKIRAVSQPGNGSTFVLLLPE